MPAASPSRSSVSAVVVSRDEGERLCHTVHALLATLPRGAEVVVVDDASTDGSADFLGSGYPDVRLIRPPERLGSAAARNAGARAAAGDVVVFCDAHVAPPVGWVEPLLEALARPDVGASGPCVSVMGRPDLRGYGLTWVDAEMNVTWLPRRGTGPYPVPVLGGFFLAMRRDVFAAVGGFDDGILGWGGEDKELCLRLWLLGYRCLVVPEVAVAHHFRSALPFGLERGALWHNLLRIGAVHFGRARLARLLACIAARPHFSVGLARFLEGDGGSRRARLLGERRHDDDWYFARFGIDL